MLVPFGLFLIIVTWALIDGEMYAKEALVLGAVWAACLAGLLLIPNYGLWFVPPVCLIDIYLVVKLIGNPQIFR